MKKVSIVQATLPTETCYNDQWKNIDAPYKKLDKLDKLAHKGVIDDPDYYSCIEQQLAFVASIGKQVSALVEHHHRVIITGDHGSSRLAQRFQEILREAVITQGIGKADQSHLEAFAQLSPVLPKAVRQSVLIPLEPGQSVGQKPGIVIPSPLAHQDKGVFYRLGAPQRVQSVEYIFPAVYGRTLQIA